MILFLFFKLAVQNYPLSVSTTVKAESNQSDQDGYVTVAEAPKHKIFFWGWKTGGFSVQPQKESYVKSGESISIQAHSVPLSKYTKSHEWWVKTNGEHSQWEKVKNNNAADITIDTQKYKGVSEIQCQILVRYSDNSGNKKNDEKIYGSKVAHIHVTDVEKPATKINVKLNNDYIYNITSNMLFDWSSYASYTVEPKDTTNMIHWTLGKFEGESTVPVLENDLADIDASGLVTAKPNVNMEGEVAVTGYILNEDGTSVFDTKKLRVGGGLDDITSHVGQKATFHVETGGSHQRDEEFKDAKIKWYCVVNGKESELSGNKGNRLELTTPVLTAADDGNQYFVVICYQGQNVKTRLATLKVLPPIDSKIHLTTRLDNLDYSEENNNNLILKKVAPGDRVKYTFTLKNDGSRDIKDSKLTVYLNQYTDLKNIKLGRDNVDEFSLNNFDNKKRCLEVPINQLKQGQEIAVTVLTALTDLPDQEEFSFQPTLSGKYDDNTNNNFDIEGNPVTITYTSNKIKAKFKQITFQPISLFERKSLKHRTNETNAPKSVVDITDTRRKLGFAKITVQQVGEFVNKHGDILDASLFLFSPEPVPLTIGKSIQVAHSDKGKFLKSVIWKENEGLLLKLGNNSSRLGQYEAELRWSIEDVPEN